MKKIIITEDQFKNLLGHEVGGGIYFPSRKNAFTKNIFRQRLDEGLYKTYDIGFVVKHFCEYLGFSSDWSAFSTDIDRYNGFITKVSGEGGEEYIEFVAVDNPELLKKSDDALKLCGYYKAFAEQYCNGYIQAGYEKRNDRDIELGVDKLYHVTKLDAVPKIMREGLVPKARNKNTYHLERIYFFTKDYGEKAFKEIAGELFGTATTFGYAVL